MNGGFLNGGISVDRHQDHVMLTTPEHLDAVNARFMAEPLQQVTSHKAGQVVIDMTGTSFMDSMGLGFVANIVKKQRDWHGTVTLVGVAGQPLKLLEMAGFMAAVTLSDQIS